MRRTGTLRNRLGLRQRLLLMIQGLLLILLLAAQAWITARFERQVVSSAETRARALADSAVNGMNALMVLKVGKDEIIGDAKARALFIKKMGESEKIVELRMFRAPSMDKEYPPGLPQELAVDALDQAVLANGKTEVRHVTSKDGRAALRAVMPFTNDRDYHGIDCTKCHGEEPGAVLGAASVTLDVQDDMDGLARMKAWIWAGQLVLQLACACGLWLIARGVLRQLGGEPQAAVETARLVAQGDLRTDLPVAPGDAASLMARLKDMQCGLSRVVLDVRRNAESVAAASVQIARGNQDLASRTESQVSALQETAAAMEQLGATVRSNADHAREASALANGASAIASRGGEVVGHVVETMREIDASAKRIEQIIGVIDGIAFRTNILALNAAVEAARAGEQGRGFAVVATEVRALAQRSAEASREIQSLITGSVKRSADGMALVERAGATMLEIVGAIRRVNEIVGAISVASAQQSAGVSQVGSAITQMDSSSQQNAALVEECAAATANLRQQAQQLLSAVEVFKLKPGCESVS